MPHKDKEVDMRFRVTFQRYPDAPCSRLCATLEENDRHPGEGEDCWENVVSVFASSEADALRLLKEYVARDNEERLRAIEAVS